VRLGFDRFGATRLMDWASLVGITSFEVLNGSQPMLIDNKCWNHGYNFFSVQGCDVSAGDNI
jgi:hypothetical protein